VVLAGISRVVLAAGIRYPLPLQSWASSAPSSSLLLTAAERPPASSVMTQRASAISRLLFVPHREDHLSRYWQVSAGISEKVLILANIRSR